MYFITIFPLCSGPIIRIVGPAIILIAPVLVFEHNLLLQILLTRESLLTERVQLFLMPTLGERGGVVGEVPPREYSYCR